MSLSPTRTLLATTGAVGASTVLLPSVTGYGTILFQLVALGAWGIVATVTSDVYADTHHPWVWSVALILNLAIFLIPAAIIWFASRNRWPRGGSGALIVWCVFYLASLFFLFPATDGP